MAIDEHVVGERDRVQDDVGDAGAGVEQDAVEARRDALDDVDSCSRTCGVRREYSTRPEPASSTEKPPGAGRIASSRLALPVKTSCSVIFGCRLRTTSRLARPRSASMTRTRSPRRASAAARFAEKKVLPTPPLPLVTARMRARGVAERAHPAPRTATCRRGDPFPRRSPGRRSAARGRRGCVLPTWRGRAAGRRARPRAATTSAPIAARRRRRSTTVTETRSPGAMSMRSEPTWLRIRSATCCAKNGAQFGRIMANSSPPKRATVSIGRMHWPSAIATSLRTMSPAWWPCASLTRLK